ncbi:uncharacterized protein LOC133780175 [Humulus lupulus]|uniref:uncharacterized protein LOC133780175 n=1 Tax=Humulus lupulus TaxID=3486 RepID=UPI002B40B60F|nr:uncharacterized protein LOC133780175 [Humulus lupulus]
MATDNFVQPAIPKFDGHYDHWSMLMENFLRSKEYWEVVSEGIAEPANGTAVSSGQRVELEAQRLKDLKAKNYLFQAIDRSILETIFCKDTSKNIWDSMKKKYQGSTKAKRQQLQTLHTEFETLRMKTSESVSDYLARTMAIVNKMRIHGDTMKDATVVQKILRTMTPKFNYVVCCIEEAHDIDELSVDDLQGSLLVHEHKLNQQEKEKKEQALKASIDNHSKPIADRGRGGGRGRGRGSNDRETQQQTQHQNNRGTQQKFQHQGNYSHDYHGRGRGRGRGSYRPKSADKSNVECYRCHKFGHYKYECYTRLPQNREVEKSNFVERKEEETLLMTTHDNKPKLEENIWYLDIGCSNHMCGIMSNVFYVPDLKSNLLSLGQLQEKGYEVTIKNGACKIFDPKRGLVAQTEMAHNRLFPLKINTV